MPIAGRGLRQITQIQNFIGGAVNVINTGPRPLQRIKASDGLLIETK